jgi:hypothetical protein
LSIVTRRILANTGDMSIQAHSIQGVLKCSIFAVWILEGVKTERLMFRV